MATYIIKDEHGDTLNTILADEAFVEANYPGRWELVPDPVAPPKPSLIVTNATSDNPATLIDAQFDDITCPSGATLTITAELRDADGNVIPLTDTFRMPIKASDGREKVLLASMTSGIATVVAPMRDSGIWSVTEESINSALPADKQMSFGGIRAFVVEV